MSLLNCQLKFNELCTLIKKGKATARCPFCSFSLPPCTVHVRISITQTIKPNKLPTDCRCMPKPQPGQTWRRCRFQSCLACSSSRVIIRKIAADGAVVCVVSVFYIDAVQAALRTRTVNWLIGTKETG